MGVWKWCWEVGFRWMLSMTRLAKQGGAPTNSQSPGNCRFVFSVIEARKCNRVTGTSVKRLELLLVMHEHIEVLTKRRSLLVYSGKPS